MSTKNVAVFVAALAVELAALFSATEAQEYVQYDYTIVDGPQVAIGSLEQIHDGSPVADFALLKYNRGGPASITIALTPGGGSERYCVGAFDLFSQPIREISKNYWTAVCDSFAVYYRADTPWGGREWRFLAGWRVHYHWRTDEPWAKYRVPVVRADTLRIVLFSEDDRCPLLWLNEFAVFSPPTPIIANERLVDGVQGEPYVARLEALNLAPPVAWRALHGLPNGAEFDEELGLLTWDDPVPGEYGVWIEVLDPAYPLRQSIRKVQFRVLPRKMAVVVGEKCVDPTTAWILRLDLSPDFDVVSMDSQTVFFEERGSTSPVYLPESQRFYMLAGTSLYELAVERNGRIARHVASIDDENAAWIFSNSVGTPALIADPKGRYVLASAHPEQNVSALVLFDAVESRVKQTVILDKRIRDMLGIDANGYGVMMADSALIPLHIEDGLVQLAPEIPLAGGLQDIAHSHGLFATVTRDPVGGNQTPGLWLCAVEQLDQIPQCRIPSRWEFYPLPFEYDWGVRFPTRALYWPAVNDWVVRYIGGGVYLAMAGDTLFQGPLKRGDMALDSLSDRLFLSDREGGTVWMGDLVGYERTSGLLPSYWTSWNLGSGRHPARIATGPYSPAEVGLRLVAVGGLPGEHARVLAVLESAGEFADTGRFELSLRFDPTWFEPVDVRTLTGELNLLDVQSDRIFLRGEITDSFYLREIFQDGTVRQAIAEFLFKISSKAPVGWRFPLLVENAKILFADPTKEVAVVHIEGDTAVVGTGLGDLDGDGKITLYDIARLSRFAMGLEEPTLEEALLADIDGDGEISLQDLWILASWVEPGFASGELAKRIAPQDKSGKYVIWAYSREPIAALLLHLRLEPGSVLRKLELAGTRSAWTDYDGSSDGRVAVVAVGLGGRAIGTGSVKFLAELTSNRPLIGKIKVEHVSAVDAMGRPIDVEVEFSRADDNAATDRKGRFQGLSLAVWPNPFNLAAEIQLSLPEPSSVQFQVYDCLGRLVDESDLGRLEQGTHRLLWTGQDKFGNQLPSGVYLIRVKADCGVARKKVVMVK